MYEYKAVVKEVYDGDTVTVDIDLGLNTWLRDQKLRLLGINAPELKGESRTEGMKARDFLSEHVLNKEITIRTQKDRTEKFGRWLATLLVGELNINQLMLEHGHAVEYMLSS